jgi:transitional endoplasmic reticulum ATPase
MPRRLNNPNLNGVVKTPMLQRYRSEILFMTNRLSTQSPKPILRDLETLLFDLLDAQDQRKISRSIAKASLTTEERSIVDDPEIDFAEKVTAFCNIKRRGARRDDAPTTRYLLKQLGAREIPAPDASHNEFLKYVSKNLNLSAEQVSLLYALTIIGSTNHFQWLHMKADSVSFYGQLLAQATGISSRTISQCITPGSILIQTGLIEIGSDIIMVSDEAGQAIRGEISIEDFQMSRFTRDTKLPFALESFDLEPEDREILLNLLKSPEPCSILLYGKPGAGKTEIARAIAQAASLEKLLVPPSIGGSRDSRLHRIHYASFFAQSAVLIMDEADNILNSEGHSFMRKNEFTPSKSLLNTFFDQNQAKIIWIVNDHENIHESTLRRFHFKLYFDKLSLRQRELALNLILHKHEQQSLRQLPAIESTLKSDFITPGILDNVIETYARIKRVDSKTDAEAVIPRLLQSHGPEKNTDSRISASDAGYSLEILNTSGNPQQLVDTARSFFAAERRPGSGLNVLLHGLPGTGKTEFVKHLARTCGKDVLFKRGSDLLSMWLGGSEKNIARAFREAETRDSVLLIDEADTFFQPREQAQRSWEVSQTNEFLNQMENHRALLFCCTNLIDRLDAASMRRFHFKLEFRAIAPEKRSAFFCDYFKELMPDLPQNEELQAQLSRLSTLTPGDFRAVKQRFSYQPAASVSWQELVAELKKEGSYKTEMRGRAIGF